MISLNQSHCSKKKHRVDIQQKNLQPTNSMKKTTTFIFLIKEKDKFFFGEEKKNNFRS